MSERFRVMLAYVLICSIWGSTWLVIKIGLETVPPFLSAALRFIVTAVILISIIRIRRITIPLDATAKRFYFTVSFFSFTIPFALIYWGGQHIPSGLSSIMFAVYPFSVAIFSYFFLPNERLTILKILGIVLGFIGIVIIFSDDVSLTSPYAMYGMTAVLIAAMMQAFSVIQIKKFGHSISPFVTLLMPMLYAIVFLLAASLLTEKYDAVHFTPVALLSVLYLSIFGTVVTFVSYFWLLKKVEAVILSLTAFVTPVVAVLLGVLLHHEKFGSNIYAGAACVLCGILIANGSDLRHILFHHRQ